MLRNNKLSSPNVASIVFVNVAKETLAEVRLIILAQE